MIRSRRNRFAAERRRKNAKPRVSSPEGVTVRAEARVANSVKEVMKGGGSGGTACRRPGSGNRRKVGR